MQDRLQQRIQRYGWDKAAPFYEQFWARQLRPARAQLLDKAALKPGEHVLDVACGTGLVTLPAAKAVGPRGRVVGTDISEAMVAHVRREAARRRLHHMTAGRMEAEALQFPDASFDVVLCSLGLMYVTDPVGTLQEMYRVLKPGGRAVASVWGARERCGWAGIFPIVDARVNTDVCPLFFQLGTGQQLARVFEVAGFETVEAARLSTLLSYETDEAACGAAFAGGPVALAYSRFDVQTRTEAHAEYLSSIEDYRRDRGYAIPGEFVTVHGRKG